MRWQKPKLNSAPLSFHSNAQPYGRSLQRGRRNAASGRTSGITTMRPDTELQLFKDFHIITTGNSHHCFIQGRSLLLLVGKRHKYLWEHYETWRMRRSQSGKKRKTNRACTFQGKYRAIEEVISLVHSREKMGCQCHFWKAGKGARAQMKSDRKSRHW